MPRLSVLQNDYSPHGFTAISINLSEDMDSVIKPWARQNTNLYLRDDGSVWATYNQHNAIPTNYVIDTAGVIRYWEEGFTEDAIVHVIEQYLPDPIQHDVGVARIIAPSGMIDSGTVVAPACSVRNAGSSSEDYVVRMRIGAGYERTAAVSGHAPGTVRYVEFPSWTAVERGQLAVSCTTELAGDDIGSNNRAVGAVIVNVRDFAVTAILSPPDRVDSGTTLVPAVEIRNLGTVADMAKVKLYIGDTYLDSVNVPVQAGRSDTAFLQQWTASGLGTQAVRCTLVARLADMDLSNNQLDDSVVVQALGVDDERQTVFGFRLASPNPVRGSVRFVCSVPGTAHLAARVYSTDGGLVRVLANRDVAAGRHEIAWDRRDESGTPVRPGRYFCRFEAGGRGLVQPVTLIE